MWATCAHDCTCRHCSTSAAHQSADWVSRLCCYRLLRAAPSFSSPQLTPSPPCVISAAISRPPRSSGTCPSHARHLHVTTHVTTHATTHVTTHVTTHPRRSLLVPSAPPPTRELASGCSLAAVPRRLSAAQHWTVPCSRWSTSCLSGWERCSRAPSWCCQPHCLRRARAAGTGTTPPPTRRTHKGPRPIHSPRSIHSRASRRRFWERSVRPTTARSLRSMPHSLACCGGGSVAARRDRWGLRAVR
mmetsp:Transcript_53909/g.141943  ORF Transcript_53909/g.141943 Transcript_53909/m.141943 type:complete len:245 (-) Transcript_53909:107-841(-)